MKKIITVLCASIMFAYAVSQAAKLESEDYNIIGKYIFPMLTGGVLEFSKDGICIITINSPSSDKGHLVIREKYTIKGDIIYFEALDINGKPGGEKESRQKIILSGTDGIKLFDFSNGKTTFYRKIENKNAKLLKKAEAAAALGDTASSRSDFEKAAAYYKEAAKVVQSVTGSELTMAGYLRKQGDAFRDAGMYSEAEKPLERTLEIREKYSGKDHIDSAAALSSLAMLYEKQGRYDDAELLCKSALAIREKFLGPEHLHVVQSLNNLALLYESQGRYKEAEPLYKRSLTIMEKKLGSEHLSAATTLNNLALLYESQHRYEEAEPLYKRSLAITEKFLGTEHPEVATTLNNLAGLYYAQGRYEETEPLCKLSLTITEKFLGPEHPEVAMTLSNLADLYCAQGRYEEAKPLYKRSLRIFEKALGPDHPNTVTVRNNLLKTSKP